MDFKNPLTFKKIVDLLEAIVNVFIVVATPIVVLFLIYSGFLYVTARGNAEQVKKAHSALMYGIIGGIIIIASKAIILIVENLVAAF